MRAPIPPIRRSPLWLSHVVAILAIVAQLVVAFAPLAEGRAGASAPAHVDAGGTALHYAHSESLCAACQARQLHGLATRAPTSREDLAPRTSACVRSLDRVPAVDLALDNLSRAPPVLS